MKPGQHRIEFIVAQVANGPDPRIVEHQRLIPPIRFVTIEVTGLRTMPGEEKHRDVLFAGWLDQHAIKGLAEGVGGRRVIEQHTDILLWETITVRSGEQVIDQAGILGRSLQIGNQFVAILADADEQRDATLTIGLDEPIRIAPYRRRRKRRPTFILAACH